MKKLLTLIGAALTAILAHAVFGGYGPKEKLMMAERAIAQFYVDTVNEDKLVEDAIRGMLKELDPHSSYSTAEETKQLNEPLQGGFSGVGISYNMSTDTLYVIEVISGGPSQRVGLLAGDRIIAVNDTVIAGKKMKNTDVQKRLRGPKGTEVDVKVLRRSGAATDTIDFRITRDNIPIYSVDAAYMAAPGVGYVRLNKFAADSRDEVATAIADLQKEGMESLILDLTDNGGGYLNAAGELLGELLQKGQLAVYTEGLASPRQELTAEPMGKKPLFADGRLVLMVNQYSASAAEITSGAVQDWDRGVLVGRRTFGKGLVQRPLPFPDGSMVRLTVAHYYTPTGRDIQKPYEKGKGEDYQKDIMNRLNHGELMHADSIHYADSLRVETLRLGRTIYGGGGITPDVFVPLDTTEYTKYYRNLTAKGAINKYVMKHIDAHRQQIQAEYPTDDDFIRGFEVSDQMLDDLAQLGVAEGVEINREELEKSAPLLKMIVKGLMARDIYATASYFKVYNSYDPIFKRALEVITTDEYDTLLSKQPTKTKPSKKR